MIKNSVKHVICAISGGVDSAVAAYLLKKNGYKVTGCFMRNWNTLDENFPSCEIDADEEDAKNVCKRLEIPFIAVDFSKNYWNKIFSKFLTEYDEGLTPNPDILCNKFVKFPSLFDYCTKHINDFDFVATGHYSQILYDVYLKKHRLLKSNDELKDQSFFLAQIDPKLLSRILFPVGHLHKNEVREIARQVGFEKVSKKSSSVGICFIGKRKFSEFINNYLDKKDGSIVDLETNKTLDHHEGIYHYTIGQRIPITDKLNVKKKRYYVAGKDFENNTIFVVNGTDHPALYHNKFIIEKPHWICEDRNSGSHTLLNNEFDFKLQHKHIQSSLNCLKLVAEPLRSSYVVETKFNIRGVTPGQYAVFYNKNECIGSGKILRTCKSLYEQGYTGPILNSDKILNKKFT